MAIRGVFLSDSNITGNRRGDFASAIIQLYPDGSAPLFALTSGMESQEAGDTIVTWFEENHLSGRLRATAGGGATSSGGTIVLEDASSVVSNSYYLVESSGEQVFVTGVNGNTVNISRGFAETTPATISNSGYIQWIGNAFEEGSNRPSGMVNLGYPKLNYMQIFRNSWDITGTAQRIELYTGNQLAKNKSDCGLFHAESIERALLFNRKSVSVLNNKPFRTMDGLLAMITDNVETQSSNVQITQLNNFIQDIFSKNIKGKPNERIAFAGNEFVRVINELVLKQGVYNIEYGESAFGMKVIKWMTPFGDISLLRHPLMVESPLWTKDLYVFHPGSIKLRYLRRTFEDNYDANGRRMGVDADFGTLTTELSVQLMGQATAGKFTGVDTAGAAI